MSVATENKNTIHSGVRLLTVDGIYPGGEAYTAQVEAGSTFEAMIRVLADRRYADDGGDLSISRVLDLATGATVDSSLLMSSASALLPEGEAIQEVIQRAASMLRTASFDTESSRQTLAGYVDYFSLFADHAPFAFDGLSSGDVSVAREGMTLEYEDTHGVEYVFEPAAALLALAEVTLQGEEFAAALQVKALVTVARGAFNTAALEAFCAD